MLQLKKSPLSHFVLTCGCIGLICVSSVFAQPPATTTKPAPTTTTAPSTTTPAAPMLTPEELKRFHRLPKYVGEVISGLQRSEIYKVQEGYGVKIEALEAQIEKLKAEREAAVRALLTPEQKARITELERAALAEQQKKLEGK